MTYTFVLVGTFFLGSLPFSVWLGYLVFHKDIRCYGDGNPGAANVFRAGNSVVGILAVLLDLFKGVPIVFFAGHSLHIPENQLLFVAFSAILGHAFSPFLHFRGGKAVAVTFGALIGLMRPELLLPFAIAAIVGFLILKNHSWVVLFAPVVTMIWIIMNGTGAGTFVFMLGIAMLYLFKHTRDLAGGPLPNDWLHRWLQFRRKV